jgi:hypothetical protein
MCLEPDGVKRRHLAISGKSQSNLPQKNEKVHLLISRAKQWKLILGGAEIRLRLAGVNSDAMRIVISACRLVTAGCGDCIGKPLGDFK